MPIVAESISAALDLCGVVDPAQYPNIVGKSHRIANQVARIMMREARLSEQNQYLRFLTLNSPSKEQAIPSIVDPNSICTVEVLSDVTTDSRADVEIVSRLELNQREEQGRYACARFGSPTRIRFTWNPSDVADTVYVGYELIPTDSQMSDTPSLPESFHDCISYRAAALIKETILNQECTKVFLDTMNRMEKQWKDWCDRSSEERVIIKPGFGDLDTDDAMEFWY